jgi:adenylate cyclase class IV
VYFDSDEDTYGIQRKNIRIRFTSQGDVLTLKHRIPAQEYKAAYEDEYEVDGVQTKQHLANQ